MIIPRGRAFGLKRLGDAEKYLDLALIKLGKQMRPISVCLLKNKCIHYSGKDVNDCTPEETDAGKCWKIKPARMATETDDSNLNGKSFLRAYGKRSSKKKATIKRASN